MFSPRSFVVAFMFMPTVYFKSISLCVCVVWGRSQSPFFYFSWIFSYSSNICSNDFPFSMEIPWHLCWESVDYVHGLISELYVCAVVYLTILYQFWYLSTTEHFRLWAISFCFSSYVFFLTGYFTNFLKSTMNLSLCCLWYVCTFACSLSHCSS